MKRRKLRMHSPYSEQRKRKVKAERKRQLVRLERRNAAKEIKVFSAQETYSGSTKSWLERLGAEA